VPACAAVARRPKTLGPPPARALGVDHRPAGGERAAGRGRGRRAGAQLRVRLLSRARRAAARGGRAPRRRPRRTRRARRRPLSEGGRAATAGARGRRPHAGARPPADPSPPTPRRPVPLLPRQPTPSPAPCSAPSCRPAPAPTSPAPSNRTPPSTRRRRAPLSTPTRGAWPNRPTRAAASCASLRPTGARATRSRRRWRRRSWAGATPRPRSLGGLNSRNRRAARCRPAGGRSWTRAPVRKGEGGEGGVAGGRGRACAFAARERSRWPARRPPTPAHPSSPSPLPPGSTGCPRKA